MKRKRSYLLILVATFAFIMMCAVTANAKELSVEEFPYIVTEGATYYESSWNFGSGRSAVVNNKNPYVTQPCYARRNGYSYLDENGRSLANNYIPEAVDIEIPPAPEGSKALLIHFETIYHRNGWVHNQYVIKREEKKIEESTVPKKVEGTKIEQNPEEVVDSISEDISSNKKNAIIIDYSGTMDDSQKAVIKLLDKLDFDENTRIIVFAETFQTVTKKELKEHEFDVGEDTHMIRALNEALKLGVENITLITDLDTFDDVELATSDKLKTVTIYNPKYDKLFVSYGGSKRTGEHSGGSGGRGTNQLWAEYFVKEVLQPKWPNVVINQVKITD